MNDLNLDKYLDIANEEKMKKGLKNYMPLYPMLRIENGKLYVGVMFSEENEDVWNVNERIKPKYWILIDIDTDKVVKICETSKEDFVLGNLIEKNIDFKTKEISKYTVEKTLQYKNYLFNDIKEGQLPLQKKLASVIGNEMEINGEKVNLNDYLISNLEEDINEKIDELVELLITSKYGSITFYYDVLIGQIIKEYQDKKLIDRDKIKLCIEIMYNYYDGVIGIDNFFNI